MSTWPRADRPRRRNRVSSTECRSSGLDLPQQRGRAQRLELLGTGLTLRDASCSNAPTNLPWTTRTIVMGDVSPDIVGRSQRTGTTCAVSPAHLGRRTTRTIVMGRCFWVVDHDPAEDGPPTHSIAGELRAPRAETWHRRQLIERLDELVVDMQRALYAILLRNVPQDLAEIVLRYVGDAETCEAPSPRRRTCVAVVRQGLSLVSQDCATWVASISSARADTLTRRTDSSRCCTDIFSGDGSPRSWQPVHRSPFPVRNGQYEYPVVEHLERDEIRKPVHRRLPHRHWNSPRLNPDRAGPWRLAQSDER